MEILGVAAHDSQISNPVIGVAPLAKVHWLDETPRSPETIELAPGHSHFVLTEGESWGDETAMLFEVASEMSTGHRSVLLLGGGGEVSIKEVLRAVRADMSVFVVAESGGAADQIADRIEAGRHRQNAGEAATHQPAPHPRADERPMDPLDEIARYGNVKVIPIDTDPALLARQIERDLAEDETLRWAWSQYDGATRTARQYQRRHHAYQGVVLSLGVLATSLVAINAALGLATRLDKPAFLTGGLEDAIIVIPILITILVAAAARLRFGPRWILLRGTAELIKSEIYRYRCRAGHYALAAHRRDSPESHLAATVGKALSGATRAEASLAPITESGGAGDPASAHAAEGDDGMSVLTGSRYVQFRVDHQIHYYVTSARQNERRVTWLRMTMLAMGGLGTLLAVVKVPLAVAVTTAFVGACATYLETLQLEPTIALYNEAAATLSSVRGWWTALSPEEQASKRKIEQLVEQSERIMRTEQSGWVREMHDAMAQICEEEAAEGKPGGQVITGREDAG